MWKFGQLPWGKLCATRLCPVEVASFLKKILDEAKGKSFDEVRNLSSLPVFHRRSRKRLPLRCSWTNVNLEKGPFKKDISSSNHHFSRDIWVFGGVEKETPAKSVNKFIPAAKTLARVNCAMLPVEIFLHSMPFLRLEYLVEIHFPSQYFWYLSWICGGVQKLYHDYTSS